MKVGGTAQGRDLSSAVDPRLGRARFFVVVDTETGETTAHDNSENVNAMQGAGIQAASNVAALGVQAVVTGNMGPKSHSALQAANIKIYTGASGTVAEAVEQLKAGRLQEASKANVQGRWV